MKEILKKLWGFVLDILKDVEWQSFLYELYRDKVRGKLEEYVKDTESKFDDVMFSGIDALIEAFLKPEEKVEDAQ